MVSAVDTYFSRCREILLSPSEFFREEFHRLNVSSALALGLGTAWVMALLTFVLDSVLGIAIHRLLENWLEGYMSLSERFPDFENEAREFLLHSGSMILYPFLACLQMLLLSSVLFGFGKLFIQDQSRLRYKNCLKIMALALVSSWLWLVPVFGPILGFVMFFAIVVIGVREVFWVSTKRALLIVLTPQILFGAIVSLGVMLAIFFMLIAAKLGTLGVEII